jgi:hypothetical protein
VLRLLEINPALVLMNQLAGAPPTSLPCPAHLPALLRPLTSSYQYIGTVHTVQHFLLTMAPSRNYVNTFVTFFYMIFSIRRPIMCVYNVCMFITLYFNFTKLDLKILLIHVHCTERSLGLSKKKIYKSTLRDKYL